MVVKFSRAQRRHDRERLYKRTRKMRKRWFYLSLPAEDQFHIICRKVQDNLKSCSCWMCGNPRHAGFNTKSALTLQEQRADIDLAEQMQEIDSETSEETVS